MRVLGIRLAEHQASCPYRIDNCTECSAIFPAHTRSTHFGSSNRCPHAKVTCSICGAEVFRSELAVHQQAPLHVPLLAEELLATKMQLQQTVNSIDDLKQQLDSLLQRIPSPHSLYVELPKLLEDDRPIDQYSSSTRVLGHSWRLNVERKGSRGSPLRAFLFRDCHYQSSHYLIARVHLLLNDVGLWSSGYIPLRAINDKGVPISSVPVDFLTSLDPGAAEGRFVVAVDLQWNRKID